jgi:hypothetical protein
MAKHAKKGIDAMMAAVSAIMASMALRDHYPVIGYSSPMLRPTLGP